MKDKPDPIEEVLKQLREIAPITNLSTSTVELAKRVVRESRDSPEELNEWAKKLAADIVDAKD